MTNEERWFARLERCMKSMPSTVEIAITDGIITMLPTGAVSRAFEKRGDVDNFDEEYLGQFQHSRIITCGESL